MMVMMMIIYVFNKFKNTDQSPWEQNLFILQKCLIVEQI
jgi:hypothetical protein